MTKISKNKKIFLCLAIIFCFLALTSCKIRNEYKTFEHGFDLTIAEELQDYFIYKESIPKLHFDMDNVNVSVGSTNSNYVLVENDFTKVSDAWANHLAMYNDDQKIIISSTDQTNDKGKAIFGGVTKKLDEKDEFGNPQKYSKEIRLVAWTTDGTRYSYQYRTFVSEGKRYYAFCYTNSLTMTIEQPLMVVKQNNQNRLLLLPLPFDTKYEVSGSTLTLDALINKTTYLDSKYYHFAYPNYLAEKSLEEKIEAVKKWYETYCDGAYDNEEFKIKYAGAAYSINFNSTKKDSSTGKESPGFEIKYLGAAN